MTDLTPAEVARELMKMQELDRLFAGTHAQGLSQGFKYEPGDRESANVEIRRRTPPPQGTALVGTESPPETFGATPEEVAAVRKILDYLGGEGRTGLVLEEVPEAAPTLKGLPAFRDLATEQGQYQIGNEDVRGVRGAVDIGSLAMVGQMPFARPAGSLGMFLGRFDAEQLAKHGRPAAREALDMAARMEAEGADPAIIRQVAHGIWNKHGEKTFGQLYKPDYEGAEWMFEVATNKGRTVRPDLSRDTQPLHERYVDPNLYTIAPGIESIPVRPTVGRSYHEPSADPGVPSEIGLRTGASAAPRYDVLRELQNEFNWRNDFPRGGQPTEFMPGGALEGRMYPGEDPLHAYRRLAGTRLAQTAAERGNMSPEQLRRTPVESTLKGRMGVRDTIEDRPLVTRYEGEPVRTFAENEADRIAAAARQTIKDMREAGASAEDIAARLQKEYGSPVTAEQVQNDRGWWNVSARGGNPRYFWSDEEKRLFLLLHRQGVPYSEIASQLKAMGRDTNEGAMQDMARRLGLKPRERGGDRRSPAVRKYDKDET